MEIYYPKLVQAVNSPCLSLHSVVYYKGSLFVFGGLNEVIAPQNLFYEFEISEQKWKVLKNSQTILPNPRCGHVAVDHESKMYIFGGKQHMEIFDDVWIYEFESKNWTKIANITPKAFHASVKYNRKWYILGGITKEGPDFLEFDFETLKSKEIQAPPQLKNVFGLTSTLIQDKMYVFGGEKSKGVFNTFFQCDMNDFKWKEIELQGDIPKPRSKHFAFAIQQSLFVFGGSINGRYHETFYECKNSTWRSYNLSVSQSFTGQGFSGNVTDKGDVYVFGGHKGSLLLGNSHSSNELFIIKKIIFRIPNQLLDTKFSFE